MISKISNSEIGSIHWLNTLLGKQKDIGEILLQNWTPNTPNKEYWGTLLVEISKELLDYYSQRTPVNPITEEERINYLRIALSLQGIVINNQISDEVLQTVDKISEKGGEFSLDDSVEISQLIRNKYKEEPKK